MKRKQKEPRRIRPSTPESEESVNSVSYFVHARDEPAAKQRKADLESARDCDETIPSDWKWNIADFRKEHADDSKERDECSKEPLTNPKEVPNQLMNDSSESLKDSKEFSKEFSKESSEGLEDVEECVNSCREGSPENAGESPHSSAGKYENNLEEIGDGLKGSTLNNPLEVLRKQSEASENWKIPVRSLKEPSVKKTDVERCSSLPETKNDEEIANRHESQNDNMPVIINVFSLSKDYSAPGKHVTGNIKQENSFLNTPPCTPPFVQFGTSNIAPPSNQNPRLCNDFAMQTGLAQRNTGNFPAVNDRTRENWYKPVQRVHYNPHEYLSYPVQQVTYAQEYPNNPVQQVYHNPQGYFPKPVKQVGSQEYLNNPVKQVNHNAQEYVSNPVQPVNPPQYLYNCVQLIQSNPQEIANGVLPLENQSSNQSFYETRIQTNTGQYQLYPGYYEYGNNRQPQTSQARTTITHSDGYRLVKRSSLEKGNGIYARFKLHHGMMEDHSRPRQSSDALPQFFTPPPHQGRSNVDVVYSGQPQTAGSHTNLREAQEVFTNIPTAASAHHQSGMNVTVNYSNELTVSESTTGNGCSTIVDDHRRNRVLGEDEVNHNDHSYSAKQTPYSENSFGYPTMVGTDPGENGQEKFREFLSPRDAKVIELKQRLEEQEATLKKLRAIH